MCGLVGVINKWKNGFLEKQLAVFENLLYIDAVRGEDSTGVFMVTNKGNVHIAKEADDSNHFLKEPAWAAIRSKAYTAGWALIGHNRKATRGSITDANAHPFWVEDKLVLVHNGSLYGDHKKLADVAVDSEAIAHVLAREGNTEEALKQINGAYALIWYDVEKQKINVIRNKERPLFWAETDGAFYFASEAGMLYMTLWRHGVKIIGEGGNANLFDEHTLSEFYMDGKVVDTQLNCEYKAPEVPQSSFRQVIEQAIDACCDPADKPSFDYSKLKNIHPGMECREATFGAWQDLRNSRYAKGRTIKVLVDDYHWDTEDKDSPVFLKGRTIDDYRAFVVFPVSRHDVQRLSQMARNGEALFDVEIETCGWNARHTGHVNVYSNGTIRIVGNKYRNLMGDHYATH